jgi:hypothetical protein
MGLGRPQERLNGLHGERRRDLSSVVAAHAICEHEQSKVEINEPGVLVAGAAALVGGPSGRKRHDDGL